MKMLEWRRVSKSSLVGRTTLSSQSILQRSIEDLLRAFDRNEYGELLGCRFCDSRTKTMVKG